MKQIILNTLAALFGYRFHSAIACANIAPGRHENSVTRLADAQLTTRFLLVKNGSDEDHIAVNGANDCPLGVCTDEPSAAEEPADVELFGCAMTTRIMVASEAIAAGVEVYTAASGKVQTEPAVAGTYYRVGRALKAASADGEEFEVDPYPPTALVVS